jgi:thiosulfate/3-mercaptopyruvate sulfurtransferase
MPDLRGRYIVETDWLAEHLDAPDLVVVDGSLHLPTKQRDPKQEYAAEHIPGALFFDIDDIADHSNPLPHMLPSIVVWWMLRAMGHEDVAVLNGGLPKWKADGHPVTDEPPPARSERHFTPRFNAALVRDIDDVKATIKSGSEQIVDARAAGRFRGEAPEPRKGLRSGHMPGARNVPFLSLQNADGTLKSADEMRAVFAAAGVDINKPAMTTCGSGVTAAMLSLALAILGNPDVPVYDGSWTEWGDEASGGEVVV